MDGGSPALRWADVPAFFNAPQFDRRAALTESFARVARSEPLTAGLAHGQGPEKVWLAVALPYSAYDKNWLRSAGRHCSICVFESTAPVWRWVRD